MKDIPLGQATVYSETYNPDLLVPVKRQPIREALDIQTTEMSGMDIWNVYEASWLDSSGKPQVACIEMIYAANSPAIVESKSLKLYFNSMNQTQFRDYQEFAERVTTDLTAVIGNDVTLNEITTLESAEAWQTEYDCIDEESVDIVHYTPTPELLATALTDKEHVSEKLVSHLFKTNCMVTGQPDWGSVFIEYSGYKINHATLLSYLISFRNHQAFHEPSCEMIYDHLLRYCKPESLSVYCRYTRRGGIDINPFRANYTAQPPNLRMLRQ